MTIDTQSRARPGTTAEVTWEQERALLRLLHRYVRCLDEKQINAWPGFFTENGVYKVYPRENLEAGLPACLLDIDSKAGLRDRALCLKEVSLYANNAARHFLGPSAIESDGKNAFAVTTNVLVVHSDVDGNSKVFCAGEYRDRIVEIEGKLLFREKVVVLDTFTVPSHLAMPI
jgi:3-phenylpropionate/cinnamic acid dioxygenase small subunit